MVQHDRDFIEVSYLFHFGSGSAACHCLTQDFLTSTFYTKVSTDLPFCSVLGILTALQKCDAEACLLKWLSTLQVRCNESTKRQLILVLCSDISKASFSFSPWSVEWMTKYLNYFCGFIYGFHGKDRTPNCTITDFFRILPISYSVTILTFNFL
jgi:hypothetical protein